jgi:integrase
MALTDVAIRKAKPRDKPYRLTDGGGLHLFVTPAGGKLWRLRYERKGKEQLLSLGPYPDLTLLEARQARQEAKKDLRDGKDPGITRRLRQAAGRASGASFEEVAREWHAVRKPLWAAVHAYDVLHSLERDVFPTLGKLPIAKISTMEVLGVLREIEKRSAHETAHRIRQRISAVFAFAIASDRAVADPASGVRGALTPVKKGRLPAITDLAEARKMLGNALEVPAHPVTKLALLLLALTALRPGTLVTTPWAEFDEVRDDLWIVPAARLKLRLHQKDNEARDLLVPLTRQAKEAFEALRQLTGRGPLVFPNSRHAHKPMSENAIGYLLNRAGYHHRHVPHGWRSTFSTVMNERRPSDHRVIDLMLAHAPKDEVESAYNRSRHWALRQEIAQDWADLITEGFPSARTLLTGPRRGRASTV